LIDTTNGVVTNVLTNFLSTVSSKATVKGWNSVMEPERKIPSMQQHWVILECKDLPTIEEPADGSMSHAQADAEDDDDDIN